MEENDTIQSEEAFGLDALRSSLNRLLVEAELLSRIGPAFPSVWRNAERIKAAARMIGLSLGEPS